MKVDIKTRLSELADTLDWAAKSDDRDVTLDLPGLSRLLREAAGEVERLTALLNAPEVHDFVKGVALEAAHQRQRWGSEHDEGKAPADWFWLVGYLGGKALHAHVTGNALKALHHTVSTAAALCNWHAAILGKTDMRPGIATPAGEGGGR
jgi:hypothetical protein